MTSFGFIGAGNMAGAIVRGAVAAGSSPTDIVVTDVDPAAGERLAAELGVRVAASNQDVVETCDFVVLAVKPQVLPAVVGELREVFADNRPVVVSIAAGQTIARIEELTQQRDKAMARLIIAEESILDLHRRLQDCKGRLGESDSVVPFRGREKPTQLVGK